MLLLIFSGAGVAGDVEGDVSVRDYTLYASSLADSTLYRAALRDYTIYASSLTDREST